MPPPPDKRDRKPHKKVCNFCAEKVHLIDYKEVSRLRRFVSERGKVLPRRVTGTCARHQRRLRSEEHTSELQSPDHLVCRLLLEKKKKTSATSHRKSV